jgi:spermidine/putrescine-binding protein
MYSRDPRRFTRRDFLKTTAMAGAGLALAACNAAPSASTTGNIKGITINYLGWEGYDYEEALKPLTDPNNIVVNSTYGGSNDEIFSKLKAGGPGQYDVVSIYHGTIASMVQNNLLQPLDTSRLTYWGDIMDTFKNQPWEQVDGKRYSVPFTHGNTPNAYNPTYVPDGIESWNDLKDPKYKDKVVILDEGLQELDIALIASGADVSKLVTKDDLAKAKEWYLPLKANARAMVPSYGEMADVLAREEAWLSSGVWVAVIGWAAEKGTTLKWKVPVEGTYGWCDNYVIPVGANLDAAYAFINQMTSPEGQASLAVYLNQWMTNKNVVPLLPPEMQADYTNMDAMLAKTPFPPDPPQSSDDPTIATYGDYVSTWEEIKTS